MTQVNVRMSTGLAGLDDVLRGLLPGDNLVWQVASVEDYVPFVEAYCASTVSQGRRLIYFRFAEHAPLVPPGPGVEIHTLDPKAGFEAFIADIHQVIGSAERGSWFLFDCLSDLATAWQSDSMLGNFFMLTCPYLYDVEAIAYFGLIRHAHSPDATGRILKTAQVWTDIYRHENRLYIHPVKVQHRHSPTMYMLHAWEDDHFPPVTESATTAEVLSTSPCLPMESSRLRQGVWYRTFNEAEEFLQAQSRGEVSEDEGRELRRRIIAMSVTRDTRMAQLVDHYFTIEDLLAVGRRIVGTGRIGGKAIGMLLARNILKRSDAHWRDQLEAHDSFYIGSDVFYTFLVENGLWEKGRTSRDPDSYLDGVDRARQHIIVGSFAEHIRDQFQTLLDYFGQSPIIVRSSSLLEDNFGHSFAGKYESVFLASQGSREQRLHDFESAARTIYASTMSKKALTYRARRGMLAHDEQMALLVQRVSGARHGHLHYPHLAGVGFSYNPYAWSREIEPEAGVLRLVFGLGTRAVDRADRDYTRIVALNAPERRPETDVDDVFRFAQRSVDVLDLEANQLVSQDFNDVIRQSPDVPVDTFASQDRAAPRSPSAARPWFLTFDHVLTRTEYVPTMRQMLSRLQEVYGCPVDVEFTTNYLRDGSRKINLVQCRPLQVKNVGDVPSPPAAIAPADLVLEASGAVVGQSRLCNIDRIIYVVPHVYSRLPLSERYAVARLIGRITHVAEPDKPQTVMLVGPGRWGTSSPELGVPVTFAEINTVSVLGEIVAMHDDLVPDVSLGTHFFCDLVEADMLYFALFPTQDGNSLNPAFLEQAPSRLVDLLPDDAKWNDCVRVLDPHTWDAPTVLTLNANVLNQRAVCYRQTHAAAASD
ncbi:pyruvate, phosphate dikinase [bacterium]|nr:pyruvate, phosphate dikinase [bacterium]